MATKRVNRVLVVQARLSDGSEKRWRFRASSESTDAKRKARADAKARAADRGAEIVSTKWVQETKWRALVPQPDGRYRERSFDTKTEAEAHEKTEEKARSIGVDLDKAKEPLSVVAERWREAAAVSKDWGAANSAQVDSFLNAHILPTFGDWPVGRVTHDDVQDWYVSMRRRGLAQSTARRVVRLLERILEGRVRTGALHRNPASGVDFGKDQGPVREKTWLDRAVAQDLTLAVPERYRAAVSTAHGAALRFQEMAGLRRDRILAPGQKSDLPKNVVSLVDDDYSSLWRLLIDSVLIEVSGRLHEKVPKTKAGIREIPIADVRAEALLDHCGRFGVESDGLVFTSPSGDPLRRGNYAKRVLYPASEEVLGKRVRTHDLRRSGISQWIADGHRPEVVQVWAGHEDLKTTMGVYFEVFPKTKAAEVARIREVYSEVAIDLGWSTFGTEEGDAQVAAL